MSNLQNLGHYLKYKSHGLNIETGYTFGLNKKQWQDLLKAPALPEEKVNQFFVKVYLSIPCQNN
ncbi:MAG: hypothetical protein IJ681_01760 [Bacteroidales bacterium]|nr:hypothetical protein [Bacteroidales bacterium]